MKKSLLVFIVGLAVVFLTTHFFVRYYFNGDRVAEYVNESIGAEYNVSINEARFNLFSRSLGLRDISIEAASGQYLFNGEQVQFKQIGLIPALRGDISIKKVLVRNFSLDQTAFPDRDQEANDVNGQNVPNIWLGEVSLHNGEVLFKIGGDGEGKMLGLDVQLGPVITKADCTNCDDAPEIGDIEISIAEVDATFWENRYRMNATSINISEAGEKIELEQAKLFSNYSIEDYFASLEYRTDHFSVDLSGFRVQNPDFSKIKKGSEFSASHISVDSLDLHVTLDKRIPEDPEQSKKPKPHDLLLNLPIGFYSDSLSVHYADIRYSEIDEEGERPGTVTFASTKVLVAPINSDFSESVVATADSYLENNGKLSAEFRFLMENNMPVTRISGSLGRFDITLLNHIFEDLEGIRITDGTLYRADFDYTIAGENADGFFMVHYDGLSLEKIDRVDHTQGLSEYISGFFMDQIALRESSIQNDEVFRKGEVDQEQDSLSGFFNNVWKSLRSGIMDAISRI